MMTTFTKEVEPLLGRTTLMGTEEYLLDRFKKEGIQKGIKIGIKKSRKEGRRAVALEIAAEMKKDKFPIETISKLTKLSKKKIKAL